MLIQVTALIPLVPVVSLHFYQEADGPRGHAHKGSSLYQGFCLLTPSHRLSTCSLYPFHCWTSGAMRLRPRSVILRQVRQSAQRRWTTSRDAFGCADWGGKESCHGHPGDIQRPAMLLSILHVQDRIHPPRKRIAQTAGFAKSCSRHKGFTGRMIAFSKTHMERNLSSCDCPRKLLCITAVPNYAKTIAQGGLRKRCHMLATYYVPSTSCLVEMMLGLPL